MTNVRISADLRLTASETGTYLDRRIEGPASVAHHVQPDAGPDILFLINQTAGVFGGDSERWSLLVGPGVRVAMTDPGLKKLFAGPGVGRVAVDVEVGPEAICLLVPHAILPMAGSDSNIGTTIEVATDGRLLVSEIVCPGRVARGEQWGSSTLTTNLLVSRHGSLVFADSFQTGLQTRRRGGYLLSVVAVGPGVCRRLVDEIRGDCPSAGVAMPEPQVLTAIGIVDTLQESNALVRHVADAWLRAHGDTPIEWRRLAY
ncbi:MAG: urease accessory protein UreD [Actinomycetota bacterium]